MEKNRNQVIVRASVVGIITNLLLAGFKAFVGMMSHSVAITMDALNNLSDAMSSLITIVGTRLAAKPADREHPLGHGRVEYLSASVIALIILYAGITALAESVTKILHPKTPNYTGVTLLIVAVAVVTKIVLGLWVKKQGVKANSESLINSGADALLDAVISVTTLAAAGLYLGFGLRVEAWLAAGISLVIIKAGIDMLRETISDILGERVEKPLARKVKSIICMHPHVTGAYDLILHAYGPDQYQGSVHIAIPDTMTAVEIDRLQRDIADDVYEKTGVILMGIGIYAINTTDADLAMVQKQVTDLAMSVEHVMQIHGFFFDPESRRMSFDVVVGFDSPDRMETMEQVRRKVLQWMPDLKLRIRMDADLSD